MSEPLKNPVRWSKCQRSCRHQSRVRSRRVETIKNDFGTYFIVRHRALSGENFFQAFRETGGDPQPLIASYLRPENVGRQHTAHVLITENVGALREAQKSRMTGAPSHLDKHV